jgi:hypothetical protein
VTEPAVGFFASLLAAVMVFSWTYFDFWIKMRFRAAPERLFSAASSSSCADSVGYWGGGLAFRIMAWPSIVGDPLPTFTINVGRGDGSSAAVVGRAVRTDFVRNIDFYER